MRDTLDRFLIILFIVLAIITVIIFFSRRTVRPYAVRGTNTTWTNYAPANTGSVVRAISPVNTSKSNSKNIVNTHTYYTYETSTTGNTTYYEGY